MVQTVTHHTKILTDEMLIPSLRFSSDLFVLVLVSAFLVIPSAVGRLAGRSLAGVAGWSMVAGVVGVGLGFVLGHALDWPEGAAIVLSLAAELGVGLSLRQLRAH